MQRSLLDQNEPLLHAESFLSDQQCRSLLASAIRPVRHNAPLQLSCRCKAQEPSLIDSWRADSESLSMAPARNYPMCENADFELARREFVSITLNKKRTALAVVVEGGKGRKQFCAFSARARFHTAWTQGGHPRLHRPSRVRTRSSASSCCM